LFVIAQNPNSSSLPGSAPIASYIHTALFACILLGLALAGTLLEHHGQSDSAAIDKQPTLVRVYLVAIAQSCVMVYFVWLGIRKRGLRLRDLIGGKWVRVRDALADTVIALVVWAVCMGIYVGLRSLLPDDAETGSSHHPQSHAEIASWIMVCVCIGFSEELVFRGYFQRQFAAITGNPAAAVILQGLLFGFSHGFVGFQGTTLLISFGILNGVTTLWRGSLRPAIIAHVWWNLFSGYLFQFFSS
jgi:uncharacterized protein